MSEKKELRKQMRIVLRNLSQDDIFCGERLLAELRKLRIYSQARYLFGYMNIGMEPEAVPVLCDWLNSDKTLLLPRYNPEHERYDMVMVPKLCDEYILSGKFGIREPVAGLPPFQKSSLRDNECLWLVPGLAFCKNGARLGRGGGYYDRLLEHAPGIKVGVALDVQLVDDIALDEHDVLMDYVITPSSTICCAEQNKKGKIVNE